ncbi:hypothetical protein M0R04_12210 [Candidatus Dojkabacteria bacterium]|jgi:hypothetical protein|nr:hypothetical protein [Candidatus Dojkabacteria bacterium]
MNEQTLFLMTFIASNVIILGYIVYYFFKNNPIKEFREAENKFLYIVKGIWFLVLAELIAISGAVWYYISNS